MVISDKLVYTRKEHSCWGCGIKFPPKSNMVVMNEARDGRLVSTYWCETCNDFMKQPDFDIEDGIFKGELASEDAYKQFKLDYHA